MFVLAQPTSFRAPSCAPRMRTRQQAPRGVTCSIRSDDDKDRTFSRMIAGTAAYAVMLSFSVVDQARALPPPSTDPNRCNVENLTNFAKTRASFSMEVGSGMMQEAVLDLRGCDFSKLKLNEAVLSGAVLTGANFEGTSLVHAEFSRCNARSANFKGSDLTDANLYETNFSGSDLRGVVFTNAILSSASFGKDETGKWANLEGVDFEGALLSSSDARTVCTNPTLDDYGKAIIGCR